MPTLRLRPDGIMDLVGRYPNPLNGKPYSDNYKKKAPKVYMAEGVPDKKPLITYERRLEIIKKIHKNQIILLLATTGVGKTVVVPKLLLHYFGYKDPIIVTTPRRGTTQSAAEFAASIMDVPLEVTNPITKEKEDSGNRQVGYKFMGSNIYDDNTKMLFSTDGSIRVMMTKTDPNLEKYKGIIIDEAHERSASIDILMGLVLDLCTRRPDFKVIIMSATANRQAFIDYFNNLGVNYDIAEYSVPTTYTMEQKFIEQKTTTKESTSADVIGDNIHKLLTNANELDTIFGDGNYDNKGKRFYKYGRDILAFLPSPSYSIKIKKMIENYDSQGAYKYRPYIIIFTKDTKDLERDIVLGKEGSDGVIDGLSLIPGGKQDYQIKIILSTPVAESSITWNDPLRYVFDSGTAFKAEYDPVGYGMRGYVGFVAQANIKQRCGRTGRTNPGICYGQYTHDQFYKEFEDFPDPDIMHNDMTDEFLGLCLLPKIGTVDKTISFLTKCIEPLGNYKDIIRVGLRNLLDYDCLDKYGRPTALGQLCSKFGTFNYQTVRMIAMSYYLGCMREGLILAAILQTVRGYDDFFEIPLNKIDDPREKAIHMKILDKFKHPAGEHLTLLNIFLEWQSAPDFQRPYWERYYSIKGSKLSYIQKVVQELAQTTRDNIVDIRRLALIKVYKPNAGGQIGSGDVQNDITEILENIINNTPQNNSVITHPNTPIKYGGAKTSSITHDQYPGKSSGKYGVSYDYSSSNSSFVYDKSLHPSTIELLKRVSELTSWTNKSTSTSKPETTSQISNNDNETHPNTSELTGGYNSGRGRGIGRGRSGGRGRGRGDTRGRGRGRGRGRMTNSAFARFKVEKAEQEKKKAEVDRRNNGLKEIINGELMSMRGSFQIPALSLTNPVKNENPVDMGPVQQLSLDDRILMAVYFGYCTHVAIVRGEPGAKKYFPRYSTLDGTIKKTFLDTVMGVRPNFLLYHTFNISEDMPSSFGITSILPIKVIDAFQKAKHK